MDGISILASLLDTYIKFGSRKVDKSLRNDIVVVASIIASKCADKHVFFEAGFVELIILFSTASEAGAMTYAPVRNFDTAEVHNKHSFFASSMCSSVPATFCFLILHYICHCSCYKIKIQLGLIVILVKSLILSKNCSNSLL